MRKPAGQQEIAVETLEAIREWYVQAGPNCKGPYLDSMLFDDDSTLRDRLNQLYPDRQEL